MSIKVHYFGVFNRAEPMRMMLKHAGVEFEDVKFGMEQWGDLKANYPGGVVPCLEIDGVMYRESLAQARYVGTRCGFYPRDDFNAQYKCDCIVEMVNDVLPKIYGPIFAPDNHDIPKVFSEILPAFMKRVTPLIEACKKSGKWIIGSDKITMADFYLGIIYANFFANPNVGYEAEKFAEVLAANPLFKEYGEKFVS
eukprot:CAMPEP_0168616860 /NCGR_PEP_ID=MMETSP0449_2-20121227/5246_1 /TAXON_ID=1082188 /ORGANISM="Strombidium rassoulzadegani, Strain ras09" /LENGTH=195 /DNA_ID=CAMNT_0008657661 /DNA_START=41 /DNA_END=628 /DNA_ORIENTATION=+